MGEVTDRLVRDVIILSSCLRSGREVIRHFELEEIAIRVRHQRSNGRIERYHCSVREEAFGTEENEGYYRARHLLDQWVTYYDNERLHSALNYLRPVDYYRGNPESLMAERKSKLTKAVLFQFILGNKQTSMTEL